MPYLCESHRKFLGGVYSQFGEYAPGLFHASASTVARPDAALSNRKARAREKLVYSTSSSIGSPGKRWKAVMELGASHAEAVCRGPDGGNFTPWKAMIVAREKLQGFRSNISLSGKPSVRSHARFILARRRESPVDQPLSTRLWNVLVTILGG